MTVATKRHKIQWTTEDSRKARLQGWDLFIWDTGEKFEIEKILPEEQDDIDCTCREFEGDDEAVAFVIKKALEGDKTAIKGLIHTWLVDPFRSAQVMSAAVNSFQPCDCRGDPATLVSAIPWGDGASNWMRSVAKQHSKCLKTGDSFNNDEGEL